MVSLYDPPFQTNKGVAEIAAMRATEGHDEYVLKKMVERNEVSQGNQLLSLACSLVLFTDSALSPST